MPDSAAPAPRLLTTKLFAPPPQPTHLLRTNAMAQLDALLQPPGALAVIAAPAGFGKSSLAAAWCRARQAATAWLTLDADDNDSQRFFLYLVAALETVLGDHAALDEIKLLARSPQSPALPTLVDLLINILEENLAATTVLVLDDYHVVDAPLIQEAMERLVEYHPPSLRVIMTARADPRLPLARWRARRILVQVRQADLAFTPDETAQFFRHALTLVLSNEQVAVLQANTEGWIAGLQLAVLSLRGQSDAARFIETFTGSHRYIMDYLVEEVLRQLPETHQSFLLATSILDRLCAELCNAVTGRTDGQDMLEVLERENLFVTALDETREWYRYHHLFAEMLKHRLRQSNAAGIRKLHQSASEWFAENGLIGEAIHHALAVRDFERAALWVAQHAQNFLNRGEYAAVRAWLDALPPDIVQGYARLCLARASLSLLAHQLDETEEWLQRAGHVAAARKPNAGAILSEVAAIRAGVAINRNDLPRTIELAQQALAGLPADNLRLRGLVTFYLGLSYTWSNRRPESIELFQAARQLSEQAGDINTALTAMLNLGAAQHVMGRLYDALAVYRQVVALAKERGANVMPIVALAQADIGYSLYEWNDLEGAELCLQDAIERSERTRTPRTLVFGLVFMARLLETQGQSAAALETIRYAARMVEEHKLPTLYASDVTGCRVHLWLNQGNLKAASEWAAAEPLTAHDESEFLRESEFTALARVWLAEGKDKAAADLLGRMVSHSAGSGETESAIKLSAVYALALKKIAPLRAERVLQDTLALAQSEGYIRTFADEGEPMRELLLAVKTRVQSRHDAPAEVLSIYIDNLLAAFSRTPGRAAVSAPVPAPKKAPQLVEPLTEREQQVLQLVAQGYTNQQICDTLVISLGTTKKHLANIFGKLNVNTRTQALLRARELELL